MAHHTYLAPCKLNLFLHITGRLANGYHALQTVFLLLDYGDELTLRVRQDGQIVHLNPLPGVAIEQDLCIRAARALKQASGCTLGADIAIEKRIPMGAGLGGGSSDAATVLLALNHLWRLHWSRQQLMQLGLSLGADVPFFIFGQTAWAEGVGEQCQPMRLPTTLETAWYVVVTPFVHVATAQIFAHQALTRNTKPLRIADFSEGANAAQFFAHTRNDMQAVVCAEYPAVNSALRWLRQYGEARMSGSGASLFIAVDNEARADEILKNTPETAMAFKAKGLKYHPHFALLA